MSSRRPRLLARIPHNFYAQTRATSFKAQRSGAGGLSRDPPLDTALRRTHVAHNWRFCGESANIASVFQLILPFQLELPFEESAPKTQNSTEQAQGKRRRPRVRAEAREVPEQRAAV